jgi:hypothetical protein
MFPVLCGRAHPNPAAIKANPNAGAAFHPHDRPRLSVNILLHERDTQITI